MEIIMKIEGSLVLKIRKNFGDCSDNFYTRSTFEEIVLQKTFGKGIPLAWSIRVSNEIVNDPWIS
jgi:hypothetical protein